MQIPIACIRQVKQEKVYKCTMTEPMYWLVQGLLQLCNLLSLTFFSLSPKEGVHRGSEGKAYGILPMPAPSNKVEMCTFYQNSVFLCATYKSSFRDKENSYISQAFQLMKDWTHRTLILKPFARVYYSLTQSVYNWAFQHCSVPSLLCCLGLLIRKRRLLPKRCLKRILCRPTASK